ncbi:MAG TPA: hypothetical protein VE863_12490 [Pyrinomonadaceae bacterium]|jgi:hypothetical protein|nr:hypothetical protein [Pyrinomonadaceae bacterium]
MRQIKHLTELGIIAAMALLAFTCVPPKNTNSNTNVNANANSNANMAMASNANSSSETTGSTINTREPDKYSATLVFSIQTQGGDKAIGVPPLSVQVARSGDDRRLEFKLPDGSPLVYLEHDNHHYVILPSRKQYAELNKESTGVDFQKMMTPGQVVESLKNMNGLQRAGDETYNGRTAEKYQYSRAANTNTKAGEVQANAYVYVDKETGLPLHAEINASSSGDVKGINSARVVAEMQDIKTDIDPAMFQTPSDYAQVPPEKVKQQIDALTGTVAAIVKAMVANASSTPPASPAASTNP